MNIGNQEIPEARLIPEVLADIKTIYDVLGGGESTSLDIAKMLGYVSNTTGAFYRRFNSLLAYKLIEKAGRFKVTDLGKRIVYPESENDKKLAIKEAVLNIPLWNDIWKSHKKNPPVQNFWVLIKNYAGIEAPKAQKIEGSIRKWYIEDVGHIFDDIESDRKSYSLEASNESKERMLQNPQPLQNNTGRLMLNVNNQNMTMNFADKDSFEMVLNILNIYGKKLGFKIDYSQTEISSTKINPIDEENTDISETKNLNENDTSSPEG